MSRRKPPTNRSLDAHGNPRIVPTNQHPIGQPTTPARDCPTCDGSGTDPDNEQCRDCAGTGQI